MPGMCSKMGFMGPKMNSQRGENGPGGGQMNPPQRGLRGNSDIYLNKCVSYGFLVFVRGLATYLMEIITDPNLMNSGL